MTTMLIAPKLIGDLGTPEILLILAVIVLLFGAKKLPDLARGSGQALRIFKAETKELRNGEEEKGKPGATADGTVQHTAVEDPQQPVQNPTHVSDRPAQDPHDH